MQLVISFFARLCADDKTKYAWCEEQNKTNYNTVVSTFQQWSGFLWFRLASSYPHQCVPIWEAGTGVGGDTGGEWEGMGWIHPNNLLQFDVILRSPWTPAHWHAHLHRFIVSSQTAAVLVFLLPMLACIVCSITVQYIM